MLKHTLVFLFGIIVGGLLVWKIPMSGQTAAKQPAKADAQNIDLAALSADVAKLKSIVPSNSHIMEDVSFHYSNLWFAGQKQNWPLAMFYFNETRNHIKWLVTKSPTTKTPAGEVVNLQGIFDGLDTSSLAMLKKSIEDKNEGEFTANYKLMLDGCYKCHQSAGRPYLHPMVPAVPPQSIISYTPDAS